MTRFVPMWVQPGRYPAMLDRTILGEIWPWPAANGFDRISLAGMNITLGRGVAAVPTENGTGTVLCASNANETIGPLASPPGTGQQRHDVICVRPRASDLDGAANPEWTFHVVQGDPGTTSATPPIPAGMVALWDIWLPGGTAAINADNITDLRPAPLTPGQAVWGRMYQQSQNVFTQGEWGQLLTMTPQGAFQGRMRFDNNALIAPFGGYYSISCSVMFHQAFGPISVSGEVHAGIGLAGAKVREWKGWGQAGTFPGAGGSDIFYVGRGQRVSLFAMTAQPSGTTASWPGEQFTWLSMAWIGRNA